MKFSDVRQLTRPAHYRVDQPITSIESGLEQWKPFDLDPDFQRAHVWDETRQQRYVEFLLRGGRSSRDIYFNHPNVSRGWSGVMVLVDGKQRLEACRKFMRNELRIFPLPYSNPVGYTLEEFEDKPPWSEFTLTFHINNLQTRAEVLQWYIDLNSGGVVHTESELQKVYDLLSKERTKA